MLTHREAMEESVRVGKIVRKETERRRVPVLLNGQGDYIKDRMCLQPVDYRISQRVEIPPGCFVMMVTQDEFNVLKNGNARMMADGMLINNL